MSVAPKDTPKLVAYYRGEERTTDGEPVFHLRFYDAHASCKATADVRASRLHDELDALRHRGIIVQRVET